MLPWVDVLKLVGFFVGIELLNEWVMRGNFMGNFKITLNSILWGLLGFFAAFWVMIFMTKLSDSESMAWGLSAVICALIWRINDVRKGLK